MANPPITRKPIPRKVSAWRAEVNGIRRFLERLEGFRRDQGTAWVRSQREYSRLRLDDLLDNAPPSLVKSGEARLPRAKG